MSNKIPKNCRYGYIRVSSKCREGNSFLKGQKQEFIQQGVLEKNIRVEVASVTGFLKELIFVHSKNKFQVCLVKTMTLKNQEK